MPEEFNKLFNEYNNKLETLIKEQLIPIFNDHEKLLDYIEKNRDTWNSVEVQAVEKSLAECYKKMHALQATYRTYLSLPFEQYLDIMMYTTELLKDMHESKALKTDNVLKAACEGIYKNFPLFACPEFKKVDEEFDYTVSNIIKHNMDQLRETVDYGDEAN
jgi:hypothetical protein